MKFSLYRLALLAGAAWGVAGAAIAADAAAQADEGAQLGEVVVTAQRRAERLTDVPITITAITNEAMRKAGVNSTTDIARVTPGVVFPYYGGGVQPSIRGVYSQGANSGDAPNVAIYIDGVYQSIPFGNVFDFPDTERIEVLKGPQGTLYGQNATGGAVIVNIMQPSFTPHVQLSANYGNYNDRGFRAFVSGPITDKLAFSIAGLYEDQDGYRTNVVSGIRNKGLRSRLVRAKLLFQPIEPLKLTLTGYWSKRGDGTPFANFAYNRISSALAFFPTSPSANSHQYEANSNVDTKVYVRGEHLKGEYDTGVGTLTSVTSYEVTKHAGIADVDSSVVHYADTSTTLTKDGYGRNWTRTYIQELDFASKKFDRWSFTAGGFYLFAKNWQRPSGFTIWTPTLEGQPFGPPLVRTNSYPFVKKHIEAAYLELTYDVTDKLTVTAGGRYSRETQRTFASLTSWETLQPYVDGKVTFSKFVPRVTAKYKIDERSNVYASVSQGFKSGFVNAGVPNNRTPAQPEVLTSYEIGYKGRPAEKVQLNVSGFYYNYKNLQVFRYEPPTSFIENAAKARIYGVDADASFAVTPELTLTVGGEWLNAKYTSYPRALVFVPAPGNFGNLQVTRDLGHTRMPHSPKFTGNVSADYERDIGMGKVGAYVGLYYNSGYTNQGDVVQGKYTTIDGQLSFAPNAVDGLRFVLYGHNLGDKAYIAGSLPSPLATGAIWGAPRTYGVRVEYRY